MSNRGDIRKALKEHGYKLVGTGRHLVYADAQGHEVRMHLGSKLRLHQARGKLASIRRGDVKSGKKGRSIPDPAKAMRIWDKLDPRHYSLRLGVKRTGYTAVQPEPTLREEAEGGFDGYKTWEAFLDGRKLGGGFRGTLWGAQSVAESHLEEAIKNGTLL
jgi:hypothetical protein